MHGPPPAGARLQRSSGQGRLAVRRADGRTRLAGLYQEGAQKIRLPRPLGRRDLEAVLINTAGGLTGGDRLCWSVEAAAGSALTVTSQACEKVYRSLGDSARVTSRLALGPGARLCWLPQETILFDGSRLDRRLSAEMAPDADLLIVEATLFGRAARGETVAAGAFRDRWDVACAGVPLHVEAVRLDGAPQALLDRRAVAAGRTALATVLRVAPQAAADLDAARALVHDAERAVPGLAGGVSAWRVGPTGKLLARLTAQDGHALRRGLVPLMRLLAGEAGVPRMWAL